jgi:hypothetical protein
VRAVDHRPEPGLTSPGDQFFERQGDGGWRRDVAQEEDTRARGQAGHDRLDDLIRIVERER